MMGMNREEILGAIALLAQGQGAYGRLYEALTSGSESAERALKTLEEADLKDIVDLVMFIEN